MKKILTNWLAGILAILATIWLARLLGLKLFWPEEWKIVLFIPILGLVNAVIGSLLRLFAAPITCLTLGLFGFIINGIVFYTAGVLTGAEMDFWTAVFGAVCMAVISGPLNLMLGNKKED